MPTSPFGYSALPEPPLTIPVPSIRAFPADENVQSRFHPDLASLRARRSLWGPRPSIHLIENDEEKRDSSRHAHVELMLHLIENRESFDQSFWTKINQWQIGEYQQECQRFLQGYKRATDSIVQDGHNANLIVNALEKATQRAYELEKPEKAQWFDVFVIRNIYDDPDLKALIDSDRFAPGKRQELYEAIEDMSLQYPLFPPECYALLSH
ncbi:hypothetical protein M407DRAFT_29462 [Tulasnella calospora MUT 4182]|uniref:Uncharacterized protein n=1 Tax=Tulasnella calospora MUT 4182 TaxID=1051891 RepID=A0A0C3QA35_9AGAM|nr:hypothetical protein M407DRAFT_29462 [Tulasnella calospora MUT 4182]